MIELKIWRFGAREKLDKVFEGTIDPKNLELQTSGKYVIKVEDKQPMADMVTCKVCGRKVKKKGIYSHMRVHKTGNVKENVSAESTESPLNL